MTLSVPRTVPSAAPLLPGLGGTSTGRLAPAARAQSAWPAPAAAAATPATDTDPDDSPPIGREASLGLFFLKVANAVHGLTAQLAASPTLKRQDVPDVFATLGAAVRAQLPYWVRPAFDATCRDCAAKVDTAVAARDKAAFDRHARETTDLTIRQVEADRAEAARAGDAIGVDRADWYLGILGRFRALYAPEPAPVPAPAPVPTPQPVSFPPAAAREFAPQPVSSPPADTEHGDGDGGDPGSKYDPAIEKRANQKVDAAERELAADNDSGIDIVAWRWRIVKEAERAARDNEAVRATKLGQLVSDIHAANPGDHVLATKLVAGAKRAFDAAARGEDQDSIDDAFFLGAVGYRPRADAADEIDRERKAAADAAFVEKTRTIDPADINGMAKIAEAVARETGAFPAAARQRLLAALGSRDANVRLAAYLAIARFADSYAKAFEKLPAIVGPMAKAVVAARKALGPEASAADVLEAAAAAELEEAKRAAIRHAVAFGKGTQQGLIDTVGAPVDFVAWLLRQTGWRIERPVMGSEWLAHQLRSLGIETDPAALNLTPSERTVFEIGGLLGSLLGSTQPVTKAVRDATRSIGEARAARPGADKSAETTRGYRQPRENSPEFVKELTARSSALKGTDTPRPVETLSGKAHAEHAKLPPMSQVPPRNLMSAKEFNEVHGTSGLIDPYRIGTTQEGISSKFRSGSTGAPGASEERRPIVELIKDRREGRVSPVDIPPIRLYMLDGVVVTMDHRRLVAARLAGKPVHYRVATPNEIDEALKKKVDLDARPDKIEIR